MDNMNLSDKSKSALKSETWQELGEVLREKIVKEYLKAGYADEGKQHDIEVSGTIYKVLERGEITTFYDGSGNTLFNVENKELATKYDELTKAGNEPDPVDEKEGSDNVATEENADLEKKEEISEAGEAKKEEQSEDEKESSSVDKSKKAKSYSSGEEKLIAEEDEMIASVKPEFKKIMQAQMDLIFKELISWTKQDPEFEKKVLFNHKSMKRCMKFCADKAMGLREPSDQEKTDARNNNIPIMTPVGSEMLFEWIKEYYDKDDKAEVEKEKRAATAKKKSADKKKKVASKKTVSKKQEKKPVEKKEDEKATGSPKKQDKFVNGQISMFDLFGV